MAKTAVPVVEDQIKAAIANVESKGPLSGRVVLYTAVAEEYAKLVTNQTRPVTMSVVKRWIEESDYPVITPFGKRGRVGGVPHNHPIVRKPRAEKFAASQSIQECFAELRKRTPERFIPLVERIEQGSATASIKLHCLSCCGYQSAEVRNCTSKSCPLWAFRPYQGTTEEIDAVAEECVEEKIAV